MKIIITENQLRKLKFKYLNFVFDGIQEVSSEKHPYSRFWKKDDEVILELRKSGKMWVHYDIWGDFSDMFSLDYDETQQVMKEWLEQRLNLEGIIPKRCFGLLSSELEQCLNL